MIRSHTRVNDGASHLAVIVREENKGSVQIDGGLVVPGFTFGDGMNVRRTPVYLGGAPGQSEYLPPATLYKTNFKGCIHSMRLDNKKVRGIGIHISLVHSHWSRNVEAWLSLVERFKVLFMA